MTKRNIIHKTTWTNRKHCTAKQYPQTRANTQLLNIYSTEDPYGGNFFMS